MYPPFVHDIFVALGIGVAALVFRREVRRRGVVDDRVWYVVAGALVGGALFGRLGTWLHPAAAVPAGVPAGPRLAPGAPGPARRVLACSDCRGRR